MTEIIGVRDLIVNYQEPIAKALASGNFLPFRVHPSFQNEKVFCPRHEGTNIPIHSHFFEVPAGSSLTHLPRVMDDRLLRGPKDIREIFALGRVIDETKCTFAIYAPDITAREDLILKVVRYPEWKGLGLMPSTIDVEDENVWDYSYIGFSED